MTLRVVSLFAGCGGFDLGLYRAAADLGIAVEVVLAVDSWDKAVRCYNANLPHPVAVVADAKRMQRSDLPPHDLVIGGPPCQPFSVAGKRKGHADPRNCVPDFVRLAGDSPFVMENVVARLITSGWSERLCAADFGDVTSRKRWFYSNYLLHVIPTPGPRRIRDIRDHAEDARVMAKRYGCKAGKHGHGGGKLLLVTHRPRTNPQGAEPYATFAGDDDVFGTLTADAPRASTLTHLPAHQALKLGLRGNSASASAFDDDSVLGSVLANSFHANEASKLVGCRNPSLLEMARAHSIPDDYDWCGATKRDRGKMIANSVPIGMATGVSRAILSLLAREREAA